MKRNVLYSLAFAALSLFGFEAAQAQVSKGYDVEPMSPEIESMCNQVIDLQIDDPDQGNKIFGKVLKKISRNKEQLVSVGDFFLNKNVYAVANMCAEQVYKVDPKYIPGLMFAGQVNKARGFATGKDDFFSRAGQKYEEVLALDPNYVPALYQNVTMYKKNNPYVAREYLSKIAALDPNDYTVERDLGDIDYGLEEYKSATENYEKYLSKVPTDKIDQISAQNYVNSLFALGEFEQLSARAKQFGDLFPEDITFKRMKFISDMGSNDLDNAGNDIAYLANNEYPADNYIYYDYNIGSVYYEYTGDYANAAKYAELAYNKDNTKVTELSRMGDLYGRCNQYDKAVDAFNQYFEKAQGDDAPNAQSYYKFGRLCRTAAGQEGISAEEKAKFVNEGDAALKKAVEMDPTLYFATLQRAYLHMPDDNSANAEVKNIFEELLQQAPNDPDDDTAISARDTAYRYIVFYYYDTKDYATALKYAKEWLQMEPNDETAKQYKDFLETLVK